MKLLSIMAASVAMPAFAEPVLVELFASQNCTACPPAHRTMAQVQASHDDVIVLTWSVDYWDYLGDPDPMAIKMSTARQEAYVEQFRLRGPYTPQTVYNGHEQCPGNRPEDVARKLASVEKDEVEGVDFRETSRGWVVNAPAGLAGDVHLVQFLREGENNTNMVHPVTSLATIGHLPHGGALSVEPDCDSGCVLVLQSPGHGRVYGAARVR